MHVTWTTNGSYATGASVVEIRTTPSGAWTPVSGQSGAVYSALQDKEVCPGGYRDPSCFYTSAALHSVELTDLAPATAYEYRVSGDASRTFSFTSPPAAGASSIKFGVVADLGQTVNSSETVSGLRKAAQNASIDAILFGGDLSYADGDHRRWDSYARLYEPLWSRVPTAHVGGNHEVSNGGENWLAYSRRYPNAHLRARSDSFLWYSFEAGPAHVLMLCSYAATSRGSAQYEWLRNDLATVDRKRTPWVIAVLHTPWYTSNQHHPMSEGAAMREALEPLLLAAKADLVINGHVHAYERTHPVARGALATPPSAGIPHITIGDGGNREHFAHPWLKTQPSWSALREYAYGWGTLALNRTHAEWSWLRNDDPWNPPGSRVGDHVVFEAKVRA